MIEAAADIATGVEGAPEVADITSTAEDSRSIAARVGETTTAREAAAATTGTAVTGTIEAAAYTATGVARAEMTAERASAESFGGGTPKRETARLGADIQEHKKVLEQEGRPFGVIWFTVL